MVITLNRFSGLKLEFQQDLPAIKTHELVDGEVMATRQTDCIEPVHQLIYLNQSPANDQAYSRSIKIEMEGAPSLNVMPLTDHLKIEPHLQIPPQTFGAQQTLEVNYQPPMTDLDCRWQSASYDRPSNWLTNSKGQVDRQRQDNSATFYNYHQTNFTPTAGFCDARRQSDKFNVGDASFLEQHQNFHYNTASSQLVYSGYGRDDCKHVARVNQQGFGPTSISHNHHHHHSLEGQHYCNDHSQITYQNQNFNLHEPKNNWPVMVNLPASHRQQTTDPAPSYWCAHSQYCYEHGQCAFNQNSELDFYQAHDWTERDTFHSKPLQNVGADYYSSGYSQTGCTLQVDNRQSASNADYPQIDSKPNLNETSGNVLTEKQDLDASKYGSQQTNQSGEERLSSQHSSTNDNESKDENSNQETVTEQNSPPSKAERLNRSNECITCGKYYARPSTLKTHQRTHTNERPYKCNACLKTFSQAANLTAHQRVHTGERPFPCPICGRQFSQSSSVITHLRTHSGERPYRCEKCSRTFSDSSTLTKHCRVHSGEKPYHCGFCSMQFSQSGNLSRHLRLHSTTASPNKTNQSPAIPDSNTSKTTASTTAMSIKQHNHSSHSPVSPGSTMSSYSLSSSVSSSISLSHSGSTSSS